jgi:hypothetical protein
MGKDSRTPVKIGSCENRLLQARSDWAFSCLHGAAARQPLDWCELNERPDYIGHDDHGWNFPERCLVLGPRRSPLAARISAPSCRVSQIGGFPNWEQNSLYPACVRCGRTMLFIAQLETSEALGQPAPGTTYAFLCQQCGMAATSYQQD